MEEGEGEEEEVDDADSVSTTGDEEALLQEAAALREHGEWCVRACVRASGAIKARCCDRETRLYTR